MREFWKDIKGFEGFYKISNLGKVKSLSRITVCKINCAGFMRKELILKPGVASNGYQLVILHRDGKRTNGRIHALVMNAFRGHKSTRTLCINHKNGDKLDNRLSNLEIVSKSQDLKHAWDTGLRSRIVFGKNSRKQNIKGF